MTYPKISVIVPVHNTSAYLEQCMDSIMHQTFRDIEIICIDDGSTDNSFEILERFAASDERIFLLHRDEASGSAALPRNLGLKRAKGKYVMFLDSDDYFDRTLLEKLYERAEKTEAELVMCDNYIVLPLTGELSTKDTELHEKYLPKQEVFSYKDVPDTIFQISNAAVWHKLIAREMLNRYQLEFQENVPVLDDIYFVNLLLIRAERVSIVRDRLIFYRQGRVGGQTTAIERNKESVCLAFSALNEYLKRHGLYEVVKTSLQNWELALLAWWLHSVVSYQAYLDLFDLYCNSYFEKLGLAEMEPETVYEEYWAFYSSIRKEEFWPPLKAILDLETVLGPGKKIVLYGAGYVGKNVYHVMKERGVHTIALWCDGNAESMGNPLIHRPEEILEHDFDALLIAISKLEIVQEVRKYLLELGIEKEKIYTI